jgi:hypothetical protein
VAAVGLHKRLRHKLLDGITTFSIYSVSFCGGQCRPHFLMLSFFPFFFYKTDFMEQLIRNAKALLESLGSYANVNPFAVRLQEQIKKATDKVFFEWCTEDIICQAEEHDVTITNEEAREVLMMMKKHHDASVGINWEVIDIYIGLFVQEKKRIKEENC